MSSKGQHVQDNSVAERRLRPIYDWLDIGNNKKALQECDKVLKKTPNLQCAKALKAVTLHRMGKEADADVILQALTGESPTDDATLQAMTLCYRELQQLEKICQLYETAVKLDPTNEELFTHLFMSYARTFDFKSQQKTAMTLFKHKPKTPYYCWAVMSIILQATRGEGQHDAKKRQLLLILAERMMEKLIVDGKLDAEQEVQLYVLVLELQHKHSEILQLLDAPLGAKLACSNAPQHRLKYLTALELWPEINILCKSILVESVDRWDIWKEYVNSVFHLYKPSENNHNHEVIDEDSADDTPDKCHEFICRIVETGADNGFLLRGPYLARFELCKKLGQASLDSCEVLGETIELFIEYFRKFGHKPCCVNDLRIYLNLLDEAKQAELAQRLIRDVGISSTSVPQSEQQMQRHLCALQLSRLCGAHRNLSSDHLRALVTAFSLHYQHGYQTYGLNLLSTDMGPSDSYGILAAHVLYDLAMAEDSSESVIGALILLHNLLKNSPSNFHAKLLSVRLYHAIGGCLGAQFWYNSLDTKHLQLDSLGFIHCARLATTGMYGLCTNLFDVTLKFFSSNYKDSSDHITFSYKYGSFIKLDEFMDFRERLNNSLHYTTVAVDRIILSLIECANLDGLYSINISPKDDKIDWKNLRDNHDLSVYISWDPERIEAQQEDYPEIKELFEQDVNFLKLRSSILWCFSAAVEVIKSNDGVRSKHVEQLQGMLKEWEETYSTIKAQKSAPLKQDLVSLPLPSRLHVVLECRQFEIVSSFFRVFAGLTSEKCEITKMIEKIEEELKSIVGRVETMTRDEKINENLLKRRESMEYVSNTVEILSISSLVCLLCSDLIKPIQQQQQHGKRGKKKGVNTAAAAPSPLSDLPRLKETITKLATILKTNINQFCNILENWSNFNISNDLGKLLESLNLNNNDDGNYVCDNIVNSYVLACKEMQIVLKSKAKMLN